MTARGSPLPGLAVILTLVGTLAVSPLMTRPVQTLPLPPSAGAVPELQPLAAQVKRLVAALDYIGAPLSEADRAALERAMRLEEAAAVPAIQAVLDPHCLIDVHINPESRVAVAPGKAAPRLVEQGWRTFLIKVRNQAGVTAPLRVSSPNAQRVFSRGPKGFSMDPRPAQTIDAGDVADRWLDLATYDKPPLAPTLSGLEVEYRIVQLYSRDPGTREASIAVDVGQGTQDIGFRNDTPLLFRIEPSTEVTLRVLDERGRPTIAGFVIRDRQGHVFPSPAKRLAPDFAFHPQVYRADGERVRLAPGEYEVEVTRGPEYLVTRQTLKVGRQPFTAEFRLARWIDLASLGWFPGDHHIHAAGCLHYETPSQGVEPRDMIRHIVGEALSVGSVLTWGPGYYHQKQFFEGRDHALSTPDNLMRYDLEVSGFPSSHAGHLVLLNLREQDYPGTKTLEDWPTWTLPILKWAREQGAVTGYAHSGWGLELKKDQSIPSAEVPAFDGIGANEYIVTVAHDLVDFISTIDTPAPWELTIWYHTLNAGFRTRISGETDFPCIYGDRVGLGRSYVQLDRLAYDRWVDGIKAGRAYVTDGRSHIVDFAVDGRPAGQQGSEVQLDRPGRVRVTARVAARLDETPKPALAARPWNEMPYWDLERARIGTSRDVPVELIVNGRAVDRRTITADGTMHDVTFDTTLERSSWIALRILPSSHTNPIFAIVAGRPIRASRASLEWCLTAVDRCWQQKAPRIAAHEREAAARAYDHARAVYRSRLAETPPDRGTP
ncbi:MAG TPA: CehA/McbA family metallohydrolase [Vicinamibacterales bacterium]